MPLSADFYHAFVLCKLLLLLPGGGGGGQECRFRLLNPRVLLVLV